MQLVYLYGPPGVGKLTVARELVSVTGFKLFHNHLAVNLTRTVFPHESAAYFRLIRRIWRDVFTEAALEGVDLVCTAVYRADPEQDTAIRRMLEPMPVSSVSTRRSAWCARPVPELLPKDIPRT